MATEHEISPDKKKVKIKNSSPEKQFVPATLSDVTNGDVDVFENSTFPNKKKEQDFKELADLFKEISKEDGSEKTETNQIDKTQQDCKDTKEEDVRSSTNIKVGDEPSCSEIQNRTTAHLKLKAVKFKNGQNNELKFVDFDNRLVTFCGKCSHCQRKEDCGRCRHCR